MTLTEFRTKLEHLRRIHDAAAQRASDKGFHLGAATEEARARTLDDVLAMLSECEATTACSLAADALRGLPYGT